MADILHKPVLDMYSMKGKVTVVTGGARGIGLGLAKAVAELGSDVALLDLSARPSEDLKALEEKTGTMWMYYETDVTDRESLKGAMNAVVRTLGRIDNCICAAGIAADRPFFEHGWDQCQKILNVNVTMILLQTAMQSPKVDNTQVMGTFFAAQIAAELIRAHGEGGSILFLSSQTAHSTTPREHTSMYGASKAAVKSLAMHLGVELAPYKIRVNSLSPGYIETEMGRAAAEANPAMKDVFEKAPPLGRRGQVSDLIGPAMWLLSDAGAWTTATDVLITGGLHGGSMHLKV